MSSGTGPDRRSDQYFAPRPTSAPRPGSVPLTLPDVHLVLATDAGVFSAGRVDPGTRLLLLEGAAPPEGPATLLDLGCGYGPVACALALRAPQATVWAIDVNERARDLCRSNADAARVADRLPMAAPDDVPDHVRFDGIWSNPPIRVGKAELHRLLVRWLDRLAPDGAAHLVVQKHLGSDSLAAWLDRQGWVVERVSSRQGYRVLRVAHRAHDGDVG